jgi:hypothetical protein
MAYDPRFGRRNMGILLDVNNYELTDPLEYFFNQYYGFKLEYEEASW